MSATALLLLVLATQPVPQEAAEDAPANASGGVAAEAEASESVVQPSVPTTTNTRVKAPTAKTVEVVYTSPGCFTSGSTHMRMGEFLNQEFRGTKTKVSYGQLSIGVLQAHDRILLPEPFGDPVATQRFFDAAAKQLESGTPLKREVVRSNVRLLTTPWEMVFQRNAQTPDLLDELERLKNENRPGMLVETSLVELVRYRAGAATILALEDERGRVEPFVTDHRAYNLLPTFETHVDTADDHATLVSIGKRHGSPAVMKATLETVVAQAHESAAPVVVHAGGGPAVEVEGHVERCGEALKTVGYDAVGIRAAELDLGAEGLAAFAKTFDVPFVAANLRVAKTDVRPVPRFRTFERDGITIAVVGLVGPQVLDRLPTRTREQWTVDPFRPALIAAQRGIRQRLGRDADVLIVLGDMADAELASLSLAEGVDVVLARFRRYGDHMLRDEIVRVSPERGGREGAVKATPLLDVNVSPYGVGRLSFDFVPPEIETDRPSSAAALPRLREVRHRHTAAIHDRPADDAAREFAKPRNAILAREINAGSQTVIPNLNLYLDVPGLRALVFGDRILSHYGYRDRPASDVPSFSDPLWMRLVTNIMREELDADFAVSRNLERGDTVTGPLPRIIVESWLPTAPQVVRLELMGAQVLELLAAIKRHNNNAQPRRLLFAAGVDLDAARIAGRRIDPQLRYTVALTDEVLAYPALSGIFAKAVDRQANWRIDQAQVAPNGDGSLALRDLVLFSLDQNVDDKGQFREDKHATIRRWLTDDTETLVGQWRLAFEDLSLNASGYRNTSNISLFANSRETRATTPNLFQLGLNGRLSATYDGPSFAWETGAIAQLSSILLDIEGANLPLQEQRDDALVYTEGRLNWLAAAFFNDAFRAVPFARLAVDSEFTPTPRNPNDASAGTFPHQVLLQQSVGAALFFTPWLKELRLGFLVQEDLSELTTGALEFESVHYDVGLQLGYRAAIPLWRFVLESNLDMRYLAPDPDDRINDLSLRLQAVNKLILPFSNDLSVFGFVDVFVLNGKLDANREFAASAMVGAGIRYNRIFAF